MKKIVKTRHFNRKSFWVGIFLLFISLSPYIIIHDKSWGILLAIFYIFYDCGIVICADSIIQYYHGYSFIIKIIKSPFNLFLYIITTTVSGVLIEIFANYLGSLWYYPYLTNKFYLFIFIPIFAVYFSAIAFSYMAAKSFYDGIFKGKKIITKSYKFEKYMFRAFLIITVISTIYLIYRIALVTNMGHDFYFNITAIRPAYLNPYDIFIAFLAIFLMGEYLEYKLKESSFIHDTIHGYYSPLFAVITSSIFLAIYMEIQNLPLKLWVYINVPYANVQILGLPVLLFLGWSLHYIPFLSIYRLIGSKLSSEIWAGDKLK